jgi:hypothetical protein
MAVIQGRGRHSGAAPRPRVKPAPRDDSTANAKAYSQLSVFFTNDPVNPEATQWILHRSGKFN